MVVRSILPVTVSGFILAACVNVDPAAGVPVLPVPAAGETAPMVGRGDRADDPAIWVHATQAERSRILGTNKEEGLYVYALDGSELNRLPVGRLNNVDVHGPLAAGSNDEVEGISWFGIEPATGAVSHLLNTPVGKAEPYGFCLGRKGPGGALLAGVTYKDGTVQLWAPEMGANGLTGASLRRTLKLGSKLEGCVFDAANETLFIGEEAVGIWSLNLADDTSSPQAVDTIAAGNGLIEDVEGLAIWEDSAAPGSGFLVASAQGRDRFVVYDRTAPYAPRGVFTVTGSGEVDAVSHTDGLDIVSDPLPGFPRGLLVVQDDANPTSEVDQNFKLVDWSSVEAALKLD
ncbi:MAG: phytase [Pseudomonadota bacterium]